MEEYIYNRAHIIYFTPAYNICETQFADFFPKLGKRFLTAGN